MENVYGSNTKMKNLLNILYFNVSPLAIAAKARIDALNAELDELRYRAANYRPGMFSEEYNQLIKKVKTAKNKLNHTIWKTFGNPP